MSLRSRSESPLVGAAQDLVGSRGAEDLVGSRCPLSNATLARKRAEQDAILLANRLRLLRAEEEKTRKKVIETESKTSDILQLHQRNEQRARQREAEESRREAEEQEQRARQMRERAEQQRNLQVKHNKIVQQKQLSSAAVREDREVGRLALQEQRAEVDAEMTAKAERIRRQTALASRSRAKSESAKQEQAQAGVRIRVIREEDATRERMSEIDRMEKEEAQLIARLQSTQERHRVAFLKLEDALRHGDPSQSGDGHGTALPAFSRSSTPQPLQASLTRSRPATPSDYAASAAADAAVAAFHNAGASSSNARPPRPRGLTPTPPPGRTTEAASSKMNYPQMVSQKQAIKSGHTPKHSVSVMSSCSTASGGGDGRCASGQSTPSSATPPPISYTTVGGLQLEIPVEEDLDLASLLNM